MRGFFYIMAVLATLAFARPAHAVKGRYLPDREFPDNVCQIGFFDRGMTTTPVATCTGSLVTKDRLVTAAHCDMNLAEHPDAYVKCGRASGTARLNSGRRVKGHLRTPWYVLNERGHDLAVFELSSPIDAPLVPLIDSAQQSASLQADLSACRFFGYGEDNFGRIGNSHGAQFEAQTSSIGGTLTITSGPNRAGPGDSGGPVLCPWTENGTTTWIQIAVTVSIPANRRLELSFHELLESHLEWLRGALAMEHLPR